jgi:hypothetical protein
MQTDSYSHMLSATVAPDTLMVHAIIQAHTLLIYTSQCTHAHATPCTVVQLFTHYTVPHHTVPNCTVSHFNTVGVCMAPQMVQSCQVLLLAAVALLAAAVAVAAVAVIPTQSM